MPIFLSEKRSTTTLSTTTATNMKKLYNKKGKVHPSPPPSSIPDPFTLLPATILTLTTALSVQDREVLSYLISYTNNNSSNKTRDSHEAGKDHPDGAMSQCDCFRCYKSFWARWDASPNRQLIHEIIEAYEEKLAEKKRRNPKVKKMRKKKTEDETKSNTIGNSPIMKEEKSNEPEVDVESCHGDEEEHCEVEIEKGSSMRRLVSFIGDRIWGVWN